jgi:hypothetical protein
MFVEKYTSRGYHLTILLLKGYSIGIFIIAFRFIPSINLFYNVACLDCAKDTLTCITNFGQVFCPHLLQILILFTIPTCELELRTPILKCVGSTLMEPMRNHYNKL